MSFERWNGRNDNWKRKIQRKKLQHMDTIEMYTHTDYKTTGGGGRSNNGGSVIK